MRIADMTRELRYELSMSTGMMRDRVEVEDKIHFSRLLQPSPSTLGAIINRTRASDGDGVFL